MFDTEISDLQVVDNTPNLNATQGAGIQAAESLARLGVETLITGHCGPKAFRVLSAAGIKVFNTDAPTVAGALQSELDLIKKRLGEIESGTAAQ